MLYILQHSGGIFQTWHLKTKNMDEWCVDHITIYDNEVTFLLPSLLSSEITDPCTVYENIAN